MNAATVTQNNRAGTQWHVIFGCTAKGGDFLVSCARPSRMYRSEKAARKAAAAWVAS
jgi:hypothetical protein